MKRGSMIHIQVPDQAFLAKLAKSGGEMNSIGSLANAAFLIAYRDDVGFSGRLLRHFASLLDLMPLWL